MPTGVSARRAARHPSSPPPRRSRACKAPEGVGAWSPLPTPPPSPPLLHVASMAPGGWGMKGAGRLCLPSGLAVAVHTVPPPQFQFGVIFFPLWDVSQFLLSVPASGGVGASPVRLRWPPRGEPAGCVTSHPHVVADVLLPAPSLLSSLLDSLPVPLRLSSLLPSFFVPVSPPMSPTPCLRAACACWAWPSTGRRRCATSWRG